MRRREVLRLLGIAGAGCAALEPVQAASDSSPGNAESLYLHVCVAEDVKGILIAKDALRHQKHIEELRKRHRYFIRLRFNSSNKYMEPYCLEVLKYFFSDPDLTFAARVNKAPSGTGQGKNSWEGGSVEIVDQQVRELIGAGLTQRPASERSFPRQYLDLLRPGDPKPREDPWLDTLRVNVLTGSNRLLLPPKEYQRAFPMQAVPASKKHPAETRPAPDNLGQLVCFLTGAVNCLAYSPDKYLHDKLRHREDIVEWIGEAVAFKKTLPNASEKDPKFRILVRGQA